MDPARRLHLIGAACAVIAAALFATKAVAIRWAFAHGADATALVAIRMGLALPGFILAAWWLGRGQTAIGRRDLGLIVLCGIIGYHAASWLDTLGLRTISAALERIVLFSYPTLVVWFSALRQRRMPTPQLLGAVLVTWIGIMVSCLDQPIASAAGVGIALVAAAAVLFAGQQVFIEPLMRAHGGARVAALAMCGSCPGVLLHGWVQVPAAVWAQQSSTIWLVGAYLGFIGTIVPVLLAGIATARLGAGPAAVIGSIGPGVTVLGAWAVLGEVPGAWAWIGFAITIAGGLWVALAPRAPALSASPVRSGSRVV